MAGDWFDWAGTFSEFVRLGWPAALLIPAMVSMNRKFAPTPQRPDPDVSRCGLQPAFIMLALAVAYLVYLGMPPVAPAVAGEP
jgi:hypothetical protein